MLFNKNIEKETIKILLQENKRLKRENQRLNDSLNELQKYKDEYRGLVDGLEQVKKTYLDKIDEFERLEKSYKNEFNRIKKLLSATGSVGMTSILANYPWLNIRAKKFIEESNNNELLSRYKDICEI